MNVNLVETMVGPTVCAQDGNKQKIILQSKDRMNHEIITTPEKVDEYVKSRKEILKVDKGIISIVSGSAIAGALISNKVLKDTSAFGAIVLGITTGLLGLIGCAEYVETKLTKLNDKFIADNSSSK
jgi:hypothetical protein